MLQLSFWIRPPIVYPALFLCDQGAVSKCCYGKRFSTIKDKVGKGLLAQFKALTENNVTRNGHWLYIYRDVLQENQELIQAAYGELPKIITFENRVSANQLDALQVISRKTGCTLKCANSSCCGGPFANSALEIDSMSGQHRAFYNNFIKLDGNCWLFFRSTGNGFSVEGHIYELDQNGKIVHKGQNKQLALGIAQGQKLPPCVFVHTSWSNVINSNIMPERFYKDVQILCKICNNMKSRPSWEEDCLTLQFYRKFKEAHQARKESRVEEDTDEQVQWWTQKHEKPRVTWRFLKFDKANYSALSRELGTFLDSLGKQQRGASIKYVLGMLGIGSQLSTSKMERAGITKLF